MISAMKFLRDPEGTFETGVYDEEAIRPFEDGIISILTERRTDASDGWKAFGEELSGRTIPEFDAPEYVDEYKNAKPEERDDTFLGRFIIAALSQKSMVTNKIYRSGNLLAGFSVEYSRHGFGGIRDYIKLVKESRRIEA
jgi:hypothetical protein